MEAAGPTSGIATWRWGGDDGGPTTAAPRAGLALAQRRRPRVLISAYSCFPGHGSEPEVGWRWVKAAAEVAEVVVLLRADAMSRIRDHERRFGVDPRIEWVPVDGPFPMTDRNSRGALIHLHYNLWQVTALRVARRLLARRHFDLVHHVTYVTFTYPSLLWACGRPFIFGPVAGADSVPRPLRGVLSPRARLREWIKAAREAVVARSPLTSLAVRRAARVIAVNRENAAFLRRHFGARPLVRPALAIPQLPCQDQPVRAHDGSHRILYVGALFEWKGLALLLGALRRCREDGLDLRLEICGRGPDQRRLVALSRRHKVDHAVDWRGHLPREALMQRYREAAALCFPSLRDSGGFVLLEALAHGCPVICLDHGGGGALGIGPGAGRRIPPGPRPVVERALADAVHEAVAGRFDPERARDCARAYTHVELTRYLAKLYAGVLAGTRADSLADAQVER